jgi:hypothetical protein
MKFITAEEDTHFCFLCNHLRKKEEIKENFRVLNRAICGYCIAHTYIDDIEHLVEEKILLTL